MLELLRIRNIAIVHSAEIPFRSGLNIISGETGAGKSVVLEAIGLLLGSRARLEWIRAECDEGVVEGVFNVSGISWMADRLAGFGFQNSNELIIKRSIHRGGKHRISINGELANLSTLQSICEGLIDLCGQNEHQSLLRAEVQLELLDRFGGLTDKALDVRERLGEVRSLGKLREELQAAHLVRNQRVGFLRFQIDEIEAAGLQLGEDEELAQEKQLLQSALGRAQTTEGILGVLESEEGGVLVGLACVAAKIKSLVSLDPRASTLGENASRAAAEVEDLLSGINKYCELVESETNPERLQLVQDRLSTLAELRRKYGRKVQDILVQLEQFKSELNSLEIVDDEIKRVGEMLNGSEAELRALAEALSENRKKVGRSFGRAVTSELKDLKMGEAELGVEIIVQKELGAWTHLGRDAVQFVIQTNKGEPARNLGKIASGGELSRIMLSIRRVISDKGGIGVYLFDEIDAGIGGQTAFQVGKKLRSVASHNQVICITHLPQVASFADHHLVVQKHTQGKRTITEIKVLSASEQKEELARMLGGPQLTRKSLGNAAELLQLAQLEKPNKKKTSNGPLKTTNSPAL